MKIAKELGISAAPALVGWEYRRGIAYPSLSGVIVAEENAELLSQVFTENSCFCAPLTLSRFTGTNWQ